MESQDYLDQFIIKDPSFEQKSKHYLNHMEECLRSLSKIDGDMVNIIDRINEIILKAVNIFPDKFNRFKYTNEVCFISNKYFNLFMRYQALRFKDYNKVKTAINEFGNKISEYHKQNIPIQVKYSDFISYISRKKDKSIPRLQFKLISLFNYIKNLRVIEKEPKFTRNDLFTFMQKLSTRTDDQNDYIRQNSFDLILESYIESNEELFSAFLQIININNYDFEISQWKKREPKPNTKEINFDPNNINKSLIFNNFEYYMRMLNSKKPANPNKTDKKQTNLFNLTPNSTENGPKIQKKEFDINLFNNLIQKVYHHITSSNQIDRKLFTVLRCSCLRFISNKYYISHENDWYEKTSDGYIENCIQIIDQTPSELNISNDLIPSEFSDKKFRELLMNDAYEKAIKKMFAIQFLTCPIDIWIEMKAAIDLALKFVNGLSDGQNKSPNISFDDFISIVLPVFASAQILCPTALHSLLSNFKCLSKSNSIDSTAVLSVALTGFISNK